jgi:hypothetical protein
MGWIASRFGSKQRQSKTVGKSIGKAVGKSAKKSPRKGEPLAYRAVTVYSKIDCCQAAARLEGQKFLAAHAPQLPLGGCSQSERCQCRYRHLEDRRQEVRRDSDHGLPARTYGESERRCRSDRRRRGHGGQALAS